MDKLGIFDTPYLMFDSKEFISTIDKSDDKTGIHITSKVTSKGQIAVPQRIRQHLQINKGDRIEFLIGIDGKVTLMAATGDIKALKGMVTKPKTPVTLKAMKQAIETEGGQKR